MPKRNSASFGVRNLICALLFLLLAAPAAAQTIPSGPFGSLNYWGVGGLSTVLNPGLAGQCLTTQGVGSAPVWVNCQVSQLSLLPPINTNQFYCNTSGNFAPPLGCDVNAILNTVGYDISRPPAPESILYKSNVGPTFNWQTLPPGTAGSLLTSGGPTNPPFWAPSAAQGSLASICQTVGALLYFDTPSLLWKCLNPGTSGQLLQTGGPSGNPSWNTVTLATLGGVPTSRNVNASSPLGGGGALSSDLTLTCATCATTTNGGPLSATAPLAISAAGVISITSPLPIANGGTNAATQQAALNNLAPTPTRAGDVIYWNGSNWVNFAGNNSGTQFLSENSSGAPAWGTPAAAVFSQNYLAGLTTSNDATADQSNEVAVAAGLAADSTNVDFLSLNSAISRKKVNVAWAVGSNAGCLDTGAVGNNTYFIWLIKRTDTQVVDVLCSLSPSSPTMPASYTEKRRIGALTRQTSTSTSASVTGTTMTITSGITGTIQLGALCTGTGITANSIITAYGTGSGGAGTYTLSQSSAATGTITITCVGNLQFTQNGNLFTLAAYQHDISASNVGTTATNFTLASIPNGITVQAVGTACVFASGAVSLANFYPPFVQDQTVAYGLFSNVRDASTAGSGNCVPITVLTNASAQIRARGSAAGATIDWDTLAWVDTRGQ